MLKSAILVAFVSLLPFSVLSQNKIDSLNNVLTLSKEDTNRVIILSQLCNEYIGSDQDKALSIGLEGLSLANKLSFKKGAAICLNRIGVIFYNRGIYDKALENYFRALKINEEIQNKRGISDNLNNLGAVYRIQKKYKEGLEYQFKALKIDEDAKDLSAIASDQNNIGNIYFDAENYQMAVKYYGNALKAYEALSDKLNEATVLNNIGAIYFNGNEFDNAIENFSQALKIYEIIGDKLGIAIDLNNIGQVYLNQKNYKKALDFCKRSLAIAIEIEAKDIQQYNYENLAETSEKLNDFKKAFEYQKLYSSVTNELLNAETSKQINEMAVKYESGKKEKENILLKRQTNEQQFLNQRQKEIANFLIIGLIIFAGIGFIFYNRSRVRQKRNRNLEKIVQERTAELEFKNKQKELMLQEIHHRVKNNLQIITSILRMQRYFKGTKDADEILDICIDRIKCMAILHDKLYKSKDFSEINAQDYFTELAGYVSNNYDGSAKMVMDIIPVQMHINSLIPCGLILNELVSNAYKYAFVGNPANKSIGITFTKNEENSEYRLKIKDNGNGLSPDFDINSQGGLGLTIVQSLVEQLDGKINFNSKEGLEVDISFPS